jgi:hypothetical protein
MMREKMIPDREIIRVYRAKMSSLGPNSNWKTGQSRGEPVGFIPQLPRMPLLSIVATMPYCIVHVRIRYFHVDIHS